MLVCDICPAGWWNGNCIVAEKDENVNVLPLNEAILGVFALDRAQVQPLRVKLFVLTSRDVMAHEYLPFSLLLHFFVRDCGPVKVLNTAELSQLAQTMDESEFIDEGECRRALK